MRKIKSIDLTPGMFVKSMFDEYALLISNRETSKNLSYAVFRNFRNFRKIECQFLGSSKFGIRKIRIWSEVVFENDFYEVL